MTIAVCFKCGAFKFGALCPCEKCEAVPQTLKEISVSVVISDHFQDKAQLEKIGQSIANGSPVKLDPQTLEFLEPFARESMEQVKRMHASTKDTDSGSEP